MKLETKLLKDFLGINLSIIDDSFISNLKAEIRRLYALYEQDNNMYATILSIFNQEYRCLHNKKKEFIIKDNKAKENSSELIDISIVIEEDRKAYYKLPDYSQFVFSYIDKMKTNEKVIKVQNEGQKNKYPDEETLFISNFRSNYLNVLKKAMEENYLCDDLRTLQRGIGIERMLDFLISDNHINITANDFYKYFLKNDKTQYNKKTVSNAFSHFSDLNKDKQDAKRKKT
jgi:hypothetical protein